MKYTDIINPFSDDCVPRILGRFFHMLYEKGALPALFTTNHFNTLPVLFKHGLGTKVLHQILAGTVPDRTAVVDDHRSITYEEMNREINQFARFLMDKYDIGPQSKVLLMMENRSEYLIAWLALARIDASPVHTSYGLKPDELTYQVEDSDGEVIVTSEESVSVASQVKENISRDVSIVCVDDTDEVDNVTVLGDRLEQYPDEFPDFEATDAKSENIVYTSGTTGDPKGAARELETPEGILSKIGFISEVLGLLDKLPMANGDRQLIVTPVYHSAGQFLSLIQMVLAGTVYLRPKFDARDTLESLSEHNINNVFLVATLVRRILDLPDEILEANPTEDLKGMIFSAAPFPQTLRERTIEQFGAKPVHELYGATELGLITHIRGDEMLERPGSVGRPLAGQKVRILNDDGNELPTGEVGKVAVQNEEIMEGYVGKEQATQEIIIDDWYTLDDLGYLDEDGYLYLSGRARDMVITGGVNVYPVEIENVLEDHPSVNEVAVIGVPHDEWGEMLVGYVVPESDNVDFEALESYARDNLHNAKVPKEWFTIDSLPRTQTGKIKKNTLEERYENE